MAIEMMDGEAGPAPSFGAGSASGGGTPARLSRAVSPDLPELREWHIALLKRWDGKVPVRDLHEADALRFAVRDAGAWIETPVERDGAQGIIDYWTSAIAALPGDDFPALVQLARFDPANRKRWVTLATGTLERLKADGLEDAARLVMLDLLPEAARAGQQGFSEEERRALRSPQAETARDMLSAAGLIGRSGDERRTWLVHEAALRHWPQLDVWLKNLAWESARFDKAMAEAQNWEFRKHASAYLLGGRSLRDALPLRGRDPALDAFIAASLTSRFRARLAAAAAVIALLLTGYGVYRLGDRLGYDQGLVIGNQVGQEYGRQVPYQANQPVESASDGVETAAPPTPADGFLWAGNADTPLLRDAKGDPVEPAEIAVGRRYRTSTDITLRADLPDRATYRSGPSVGILPAGALVEVVDPPVTYPRDSGTQYWIRIQRVTTVYVQYDGGGAERAKARALIAALLAQGYNVAKSADRQTSARGIYQIRYSYAEDYAQAQKLADALSGIATPSGSVRTRCFLMRLKKRNSSGVIEVWIDPRTVNVRPAPAAMSDRRISCEQPLPSDALATGATAKN